MNLFLGPQFRMSNTSSGLPIAVHNPFAGFPVVEVPSRRVGRPFGAKLFVEVGVCVRRSFVHNHAGVAFVPAIPSAGAQAQISWFVVFIVVNSIHIQSKIVPTRKRHCVAKEPIPVFQPFLANSYASPTVVWVSLMPRIVAARNHSRIAMRPRWTKRPKRDGVFSISAFAPRCGPGTGRTHIWRSPPSESPVLSFVPLPADASQMRVASLPPSVNLLNHAGAKDRPKLRDRQDALSSNSITDFHEHPSWIKWFPVR